MLRIQFVFLVLAICAVSAFGAIHDITASGTSFSPQFITINLGDTVRWTNTNGVHNVVHAGTPRLFRSGDPAPPSSSVWPFTFSAFPQAGFYDYFCEPHAAFGMAGMITVQELAAPEIGRPLAEQLVLKSNYPNPFNPETRIEFSLPSEMNAEISVLNLLGQEVAVLANGRFGAGDHAVTFDASRFESGVYFYRIDTPIGSQARKMVLVK